MTSATTSGPRVSVVIPAYNSAVFLPETLDSVLAQTYPAFEIFVVDDGSTDNTEEVAARYSPRVTYVRQANQGVSTARNVGLEQSQGEWVCFLDADDVWHSSKLSRQIQAIQRDPEVLFVFTGFYLFGSQSGICRLGPELQAWDRERHLLVPTVTILPSTAMVRREAPVRFPCWAGNNEDSIYFNELAEVGRFTCLDEPLVGYRKHPTSAQASLGAGDRAGRNLYRWAVERTPSDPSFLSRLLDTVAALTLRAKWKRDWRQYWSFREFAWTYWPESELPAVFREHVLPPLAYCLKDIWDRFAVIRS